MNRAYSALRSKRDRNPAFATVGWLVPILLLTVAATVHAADRVALVIGNETYQHGNPLKNPVADAEDMATSLRACGFSLVGDKALADLSNEAMAQHVEEFRKLSTDAKVVLFFYAGHGLEVDGANYLVPVDAEVTEKYQVRHRTLALDEILHAMETGGEKLKIVILDCCRDNPLGRGWGRSSASGLSAPKSTPNGTVLLFSAAPGEVAADGQGRNSPFTEVLKDAILTPGVEIEKVFKQVGSGVWESTGRQRPWMNSSFYGEFAFVTGETKPVVPETNPKPVMTAKTEPKAADTPPDTRDEKREFSDEFEKWLATGEHSLPEGQPRELDLQDFNDSTGALEFFSVKGEMESVTRTMQAMFDNTRGTQYLDLLSDQIRERTLSYYRKKMQLQSALEKEDYDTAQSLVNELKGLASDFDYSKPQATIEAGKIKAKMRQ